MRRISTAGMLLRSSATMTVIAVGALLLAACQPAVDVSRVPSTVRSGLPVAPPDPSLLPLGRDGAPMRPSAAEGSKVFLKAQCVVCHGPEGLGNGPAAANLKSPGKDLLTDFLGLLGIRAKGEQLPSHPANFHNVVQMRLNSPFSMYETVTRGRPHTAMPSFGPRPAYGAATFGVRLTDDERWHVIFFEWSFTTTPEDVAHGKQIYETRQFDVGGQMMTCVGCHGTGGDGRGPHGTVLASQLWNWARGQGPGVFTDFNLMAQRKPTELFQTVFDGRGQMPAYRDKLSTDEIWAVVNYIWTFVYDYPGKR